MDIAQSWCALFPLTSRPFTEAEVVIRLENDRATLLDIDQGAAVYAIELDQGSWEVRPLEGTNVMTGFRRAGWQSGYAETSGLLPLVIPRAGRTVSPYAATLASRDWAISPSVGSVETWTHRSTELLRASMFEAGLVLVGLLGYVALNRSDKASVGFALAIAALLLVRLVIRTRKSKALHHIKQPPTLGTTPISLAWRPADEGGCLAWALIDDDKHGRLEAPIVGLNLTSIDLFPTTAEVGGELAPGNMIKATLADGTTLFTIRPLAVSR